MADRGFKSVLGTFFASSLLLSSSAASAIEPVSQVNPWAVLTAMSSGAPAATICGTSAVATAATPAPVGCVLPVTDAATPPSVKGLPPAVGIQGGGVNSLLLGLMAIASGVGGYFAIESFRIHVGSYTYNPPNSPP